MQFVRNDDGDKRQEAVEGVAASQSPEVSVVTLLNDILISALNPTRRCLIESIFDLPGETNVPTIAPFCAQLDTTVRGLF